MSTNTSTNTNTIKRDYAVILRGALEAAAKAAPDRPSGCGRVYVCVPSKDYSRDATEATNAQAKKDALGIARAAGGFGKIWQAKNHYGDRNALYVGYDNSTGRELGVGRAIVDHLKAHGIQCYRTEHGD